MVKRISALTVFMNGILVGILSKTSSGDLSLTYEQSWIDSVYGRPISLSLPLSKKIHEGISVYNFFDNLLPENFQTRSNIQRRFKIASKHPFDLLAGIGHDCVGAIQLCREDYHPAIQKITGELLDDDVIAYQLTHCQELPLGMDPNNEDFRISIAGVQEKIGLLRQNDQWFRPTGATPTTHILKLPIGRIEHQNIDLTNSCENEWLCAEIVKAFGLPMARMDIAYFNDVKVLVVERFDRKLSEDNRWIVRLPQEDMCQALGIPPEQKYQSDGGPGIKEIMDLLLGSEQPNHDRELFFQTQVLFWMLAAIDGHAKNFSIFLEAQGRFKLAPLYDVISAYPLISAGSLQKQKVKMAMALKGVNNHYHWHNIKKRHFISTAKLVNYSVSETEKILGALISKVEGVISEVSNRLPSGFPSSVSDPIFEGMRKFSQSLGE